MYCQSLFPSCFWTNLRARQMFWREFCDAIQEWAVEFSYYLRRLEEGIKCVFRQKQIQAVEKYRPLTSANSAACVFSRPSLFSFCVTWQTQFNFCSDATSLFSVCTRAFLTLVAHIFCPPVSYSHFRDFTHPHMVNIILGPEKFAGWHICKLFS